MPHYPTPRDRRPKHRPHLREETMEVVRIGYTLGIAPRALADALDRHEATIRRYAALQGLTGPGEGNTRPIPNPVPWELLVALAKAGMIEPAP